MVRPKNETEDFLLPITKNYETLIHQTHTKPQEKLEFKLTQARESFSIKPSIIFSHDSNWMIGLTSLEVYKIILNIIEEDNKFEFYRDSLMNSLSMNRKMNLRKSLEFRSYTISSTT